MLAAMLLGVTAASQRFGLSARQIRRLVANGKVRGERLSARFWTVDERSLRAYLASERRPGPVPRKP